MGCFMKDCQDIDLQVDFICFPGMLVKKTLSLSLIISNRGGDP
jgi:hypothetical protein